MTVNNEVLKNHAAFIWSVAESRTISFRRHLGTKVRVEDPVARAC